MRDESGKEPLVEKILALEWEMFQEANGSGPKASCQLDRARFGRMRACQYLAWSVEHLQSWLEDLELAASEGRNLAAEKYIRMMEDSHPEEFSALAGCLPEPDPEARALAAEISAAHMRWKEELDRSFPALAARGRARSAQDASPGAASFESYLRCELLTCSPRTLAIYLRDVRDMLAAGESEARLNLLNQAREAGFDSLENAEEHFRRRA